ncbi:HD domain-containing protein [Pirellulales bacterium]|nr:HD domain-containing protein [Pirellulales bacterium]
MNTSLRAIPELAALRSSRSLIRIPPETDVPMTPRVRRLIDTPAFRRLGGIRQLGLVSLVYPGANHSRFEHSLGAYRTALLFLDRLAENERFAAAIPAPLAETFLVAALLHDIGHWPFCHPIEDLAIAEFPSHEELAQRHLQGGEIRDALAEDWGIEPGDAADLLHRQPADASERILASLLSGPIDVDKMDYLARDSLHAGVPYGRNFDSRRLVQSLCLNAAGDHLAITDKGKTAAEMMVFARYVMFSEVYWHHAVRSATAMLQRAFFDVHPALDLAKIFALTDQPLIDVVRRSAADNDPGAAALLDGLFGDARRLYKRIGQYSLFQERELYERLARRPYPWLKLLSEELARRFSELLSQPIASHELLIDAPPTALEVQFKIDVFYPKEDCYRSLGEVSPVVRALAEKQFDDYVKRVRLFVHPRISDELQRPDQVARAVVGAIDTIDTA